MGRLPLSPHFCPLKVSFPLSLSTTEIQPLRGCYILANVAPSLLRPEHQHLPSSARGHASCSSSPPPYTSTVFCTGQCLDHCHPVFSVSCMRLFAFDCVAASPIHLCLSLPVPFIFLHLPRIVECAHSANSQWHASPQSCSSLSGVAAFSEANGACAVSRACVSRHGGCSVERYLSACCVPFLRSWPRLLSRA